MDNMSQGQGIVPTASGGTDDVSKNKGVAVITAVLPILFFLPLLTDAKHSPFAMHYANRSLLLLIAAIVLTFIPILGWLLNLVTVIFWLIGIIGASSGVLKPLPLVSNLQILKP